MAKLIELVVVVLCATAIVSSLPISDKFQESRISAYRNIFPYSQESDVISFPEESYNSLLGNEFRYQRAVDPKSRLQNIIRNPSRIIFDEDNDEPLVPEPIFEMLKYPTPGTPSNQRIKVVKIVPIEPKLLKPVTTTPRTRQTSARPIYKSTTQNTVPKLTATNPVSQLTTPKTVPKSSTPTRIPKSTTPATTTKQIIMTKPISITAESPECVESQEGDCDEILVEGSVYTPFRVHPPNHGSIVRRYRTGKRNHRRTMTMTQKP